LFNDRMGSRIEVDGQEMIRVSRGETGHAVFGPYTFVRPAMLEVDYDLALADAPPAEDETCAVIEITAMNGTVVLARRELRPSDLSRQLNTFTLALTLREFRSLEFRVLTLGVADLIAGQPRMRSIGPVTDLPPPADPMVYSPDPIEQHRQTRAVLSLLRPHQVRGFRKVRLGHPGDGGYVCVDDFAGLDTALSFGINDDVSWDMDAADRGLTIHQFDHTVDDPAPDDHRMIFNKKMIAPESSDTSASLADLIRLHDKGNPRPNMMLKMDIEGHEWPVIAATDTDQLARFSQIVCELHYFQGLAELDYRRQIYQGLKKLHEDYRVVHVHANIVGGTTNIGNVIFPNVLEVTFANRNVYEIEDTDELFPSPLDICCDPNQADMFLGAFRF
jgi:hypothetical protein